MPFPGHHIFKCYAVSTDVFVLVEASSHEEAVEAAHVKCPWWLRSQIITRYLITRTHGKLEQQVTTTNHPSRAVAFGDTNLAARPLVSPGAGPRLASATSAAR